jgi:hypothetical protein
MRRVGMRFARMAMSRLFLTGLLEYSLREIPLNTQEAIHLMLPILYMFAILGQQ